MRRYGLMLLAIVLAGSLGANYWFYHAAAKKPGPSAVSVSTLVEQTRAVARLVTLEVVVQDVVEVSEVAFLRDKKMLVVEQGKALVGLNLDEITADRFRKVGDGWEVTLPQPQVLEVVTYPETARTFDVQKGLLWIPVSSAKVLEAEAELKHKVRSMAEQEEYTTRARQSAVDALTSTFTAARLPVSVK